MIDVMLFKNNETIKAFEISGHANSGPYGYDLVCAGVTAVSFGAVNALMEIGETSPKIDQEENGGYLYVELPPNAWTNEAAQTILKAMIVSLKTIEQEYDQFIQIKSK